MNENPPFRGFGYPNQTLVVHHGGPGPWGWTIFALQLVLIAGVAWLLVSMLLGRLGRRSAATVTGPAPAAPNAPLELLNLRYARGELGRDDYLQARADLGGEPAPPAA